MNLPNRLTLARIALVPIVCVCMALQKGCMAIAAVLFVLGAATDFLDGRIARSRHLVTDFGKFADPVADKLLVFCPMILLAGCGRLPAWMCAVMVARELTVTGFRLVAAGSGRVIAADKLGKYKTTVQMLAVLAAMLLAAEPWHAVTAVLAWAAVLLTVVSGAECIWRNRAAISDM